MNRHISPSIDLAHVPPFTLGGLWVDPANRLIRRGATEQFVEPRVLKVIVAFAEAGDTVLSRDDLIACAWGGRIVGDNAIQRAISRVRELASTIGANSFHVETIKGVGYRMRSTTDGNAAHPAEISVTREWWTRRGLLAGAAAGGAATLAFGLAPMLRSPGIDATGRKLFERAEAARRDNEGDVTAEQAISLYRAAIERSPEFGDAWSGLALAYCQLMDSVDDDRVREVAQLAQSVAHQALSLDQDSIKARAAMVLARPRFRRWHEQQLSLQSLEREKKIWEIPAERARINADVAKFALAIGHSHEALTREPMLARAHAELFYSLWILGRLHEADDVMAQARRRWPRHYGFWSVLFRYFVTSGRHEEAALLLRQEQNIPLGLGQGAIPIRQRLLDILAGGNSSARGEYIQYLVKDAEGSPWALRNSIRNLAMIGERSVFYLMLDGFFRGSGPYARRLTPYSRLPTAWIYAPYFDDYRDDNAFRSLTGFLGLPVSAEA